MRYFKKELPEQALYVMGHPFRFDFLETEDAVLIGELDNCIRAQRGGVVGISKEEYEAEVKKKSSATESLLNSNGPPPPHRRELVAPNRPSERRVAEVVGNPGGRRSGMFGTQFAHAQRDRGQQSQRVGDLWPMPDPIQIPSPAEFIKPPTAKVSDLK